jgi:hypothetical protein
MKILKVIFPFILFLLLSFNNQESDKQKIIGKWSFEEYQEAEKSGSVVTVTLTRYVDAISFEFKSEGGLEVVFSDSKIEYYGFKFKRDMIEIIPESENNFTSDICGTFELSFQDKISKLFLQRKGKPHHGIMLKKGS